MGRLTEANYLSRKVKLHQHIDAAKTAHRDAAFRHEIGEGDEAAVVTAKAAISALEDRLMGLDAAWARAQEEAAKEQRERDEKSRAATVATVEKHLKARAQASRHLSKLAQELGEAWQKYEAEGQAVIEAARPYGRHLGVEGFRQLRDLLQGDFHSPKPSLGSEILDAGLRMLTSDFPAAHMRKGMNCDSGIVEFTEKRNGMAKAVVASLLEAEQ